MNRTACTLFFIWLLSITPCLNAFGRIGVRARRHASGQQDAPQIEPAIERDEAGRVSIKPPRNVRVAVGNRTTGRITITGWDRDTIEARAISEQGNEFVRASVNTDSAGARVFLKADYASEGRLMLAGPVEMDGRRREILKERLKERDERRREREARRSDMSSGLPAGAILPVAPQASPTPVAPGPLQTKPVAPAEQAPTAPFVFDLGPREIHLEVKLPRHAEIELITVFRSDVEITGVDTHIVVSGDKSTIKLSRVGAAEVRTNSGPVEVKQVRGLVDVVTTSGPISVRDAGGDVRLLSISGHVEVQCVRGRVNVGNTNGPVNLASVGGDVDVTTTASEIRFAGAIRKDGTYHLKTMSGPIEMVLLAPGGFTAVLSSYRGTVESNFPMKIIQSTINDPVNHRLTGRFGNGQAQISLDSFDGVVRLNKAAPGTTRDCQ